MRDFVDRNGDQDQHFGHSIHTRPDEATGITRDEGKDSVRSRDKWTVLGAQYSPDAVGGTEY